MELNGTAGGSGTNINLESAFNAYFGLPVYPNICLCRFSYSTQPGLLQASPSCFTHPASEPWSKEGLLLQASQASLSVTRLT